MELKAAQEEVDSQAPLVVHHLQVLVQVIFQVKDIQAVLLDIIQEQVQEVFRVKDILVVHLDITQVLVVVLPHRVLAAHHQVLEIYRIEDIQAVHLDITQVLVVVLLHRVLAVHHQVLEIYQIEDIQVALQAIIQGQQLLILIHYQRLRQKVVSKIFKMKVKKLLQKLQMELLIH